MIVGVAFSNGELTISMPRPARHFHIINACLFELHEWEQGFLTDNGLFINRHMALAHVIRCGQIVMMGDHSGKTELFSEDLW